MNRWSKRGVNPRSIMILTLAGALFVSLTPLTSSAAAPTEAPTALTPMAGQSVNANPVFTWTAVSGAARYKVQIASNPNFTPTATADTYNTSYAHPKDLDVGTLYWRVAATDSQGNPGPYSDAISFQKTASDAPVVKTPADDATLTYPTEPPVFSWDPVPGAQKYRLQIDDAEDFIGATEYPTVNTSVTLIEPQTIGQSFFWRVQGVSKDNINTEWSPVRNYSIAWPGSPTLVSPADSQVIDVEDVVLKWQPVVGAASYHLQISPNIEFSNNITIEEKDLRTTSYSPPANKQLNNADYYWRVRAKDARSSTPPSAPNFGPWSVIRRFHRAWNDKPQLIAPADNTLDLEDLNFSWTPVDHAAYYEIQMSTDPNFSPGSLRNCFTNHTSWSPHAMFQVKTGTPHAPPGATCAINEGSSPWPLVGNPGMYWKVRGIDPGSSGSPIEGVWSETRYFIYQVSAPVMISPLDGQTTPTPLLEWEPIVGASFYQVTIIDKNGTPTTAKTAATSYVPTKDLLPISGPYSWHVQAFDGDGRLGYAPAAGQDGSFQTVKQCPIPPGSCVPAFEVFAQPDPLSPVDGHASSTPPAMTWQPVDGAAHYRVFYGRVGASVASQMNDDKLYFNGYTHDENLTPGDYYWYVNAYNSSNSLISTGMSRTFTISAFDLTGYVGPEDCTDPASCTPYADTPTMDWDIVPDANYYLVHLSQDAAFTNVIKTYMTPMTSLTPRESLLDSQAGPYYWFVQSCRVVNLASKVFICGAFNDSVFPSAWAFKKESAAIQLQSPAPDSTVADQVTFEWNDFLETNQSLDDPVTQEAKLYRIQVSTVADFATILDTRDVDQTSYTAYDMTYPEGPLYWRVQAIDGSSNLLTQSAVRKVTKSSNKPVMTHPANGASVDGVPHFRWEPQAFTKKYEIEVYKNGDTNFAGSNLVTTASSKVAKLAAWSPTVALPAGTYAWRVRRLDSMTATSSDDGRPGPWSEARTFTLQPDAPSLVAPETGTLSTDDNVLFDWNGVTGASHYKFEMSTSPTFASSTSVETVMTEWAPTTKVTDATYYWRVSPVDGGGNVGPASTSRTWIKDMTAPETSLSAAISGIVPTTRATFSFTSSDATATFNCSIDDAAWQACSSPKTYSGLAQGQHSFEVRAIDGADNADPSPSSATWTVSTINVSKLVYRAKTVNGEYVQISNTFGTPVKLTGWKIVKGSTIYKFPTFTLPGKGKVKVHTGRGSNTKTDLYWKKTKPLWNNTKGSMKLKRADGTLADTCIYNNPYVTYTAC